MNIPTQEQIEQFLHGSDPEKYIVGLEFGFRSGKIYKIKEYPDKGKVIEVDTFTPFCWVGDLRSKNFYRGNKQAQKEAISKHGIIIEKLETYVNDRLENGLTYLVKTTKDYNHLVSFFREGGLNPWGEDSRDFILMLPPIEQYLIQKEKRLFKGFEDYNDVHRFVFDLETTSLSPKDGRIFMIGMKDNRGFEKVIEVEDNDYNEILAITEFFETIDKLKPTIIGGYNSSNFDWDWLFERSRILGLDISEFKTLNPNEKFKMSKGTLKLGAEMEEYNKIGIWGYNSIDIAHSVRRAQTINSDIKSWGLKYITKFTNSEKPNRVYVQGDKIASTYKENLEYFFNPKTGQYRLVTDPKVKDIETKYPGVYERVNGKYIVERYLLDDIWETLEVDAQFNQASFLLSSMVPTSYERASTMGTATLWKMLMLAWSYTNNLAIPKKDEKRPFVGGLSRLLKTGYSTNVLKLDFSSLYPSIQLVHDVFPECDVTGAMKSMLKYFRDTRIKYKNLTSEYKNIDKKVSETYGRKQLPIKIFINSMFGSLSAPQVFPWGDMNKGEEVTCTGRQYLRHMIRWFMDRGYEPLVLDTDGVNFSTPKDVENIEYVGKGNNDLVVKDKVYVGTDAHVAEYNDLYMVNEMGLDTDGTWPACINVARKNYALLTDKGKVKLTGNSIKSKKLQGYVEEFIDKGLTMLLNGEGQSFIDYYYEYIEKIYNKEIPLSKIANKSNVKQSVSDYKIRSKQTSKSGSLMSKQAHMELIIQEGLKVDLGDTIYYVNNGTRKSHGDVQNVNKPKKGWSQEQLDNFFDTHGVYPPDSLTTMVKLNCYRIPKEDIENNPGLTGNYNVPRYISTFNKRVEPLLVCFKPEIRDNILIEDPKDRQYFTKSQCELINGIPRKPEDQDSLGEILDLSEDEVNFWSNVKQQNENYFMESLGIFDTVR